ncbi:MAG: SDR family oxidoreductase [Candidatus Hydrogenedentes bacterium]|nr:SDR family oxidoreductase [Candidatus Hydrogenedentota bacterium]
MSGRDAAKRLLVTGANGFVAGSVISHALTDWEAHAVSRSATPVQRNRLFWHTLDTVDCGALRGLFEDICPHAVIHAAAVADIDYCQAHQEEAWRVNVELTRTLVLLCSEHGAKLVHISTDTVFDGERGRYREEDAPGPVNYYAKTKADAESVVAGHVESWVVARLALVVGLPVLGAGNSFLSRMIPVLEQGRELGVPDDEIRSPIDVITLGRALLELAENDFTGFLHLAGNDVMNRHTMAQRIAERLGLRKELVVARSPRGIPGRAPRPRDVSLDNGRAKQVLGTPMVGLDSGLDLVLGRDFPDSE